MNKTTAAGTTRAKTVRRPRAKVVTASKAAAPAAEPMVERTASPIRATSLGQANGTTRPAATERKRTKAFDAPPRATTAPVVVLESRAATVSSGTVGEAVDAARTMAEAAPTETSPREAAPRETLRRDTVPGKTAPRDTAPTEMSPKDTASGKTAPREIAPREIAPRETSPLVAAFGDSRGAASLPERPTRPDVTSLPTTIMQVGRTQVEQSLALGQTILGARTVQDLMALQIKCIEQSMNHAFTWARLSTAIMRDGMAPPTRR